MATSNARNEAMFREASTFAAHLRQVEKDLTAWERDIEGGPCYELQLLLKHDRNIGRMMSSSPAGPATWISATLACRHLHGLQVHHAVAAAKGL